METLGPVPPASSSTEPEINLLLARDTAGDLRRGSRAAMLSVLAHVVTLILMIVLENPSGTPHEEKVEREQKPIVIPLYTPPELTQKAPNLTKPKNELSVETIVPRQVLKAPAPAPAPAARAAMKTPPPAPVPVPEKPKEQPKIVVMEAPKVEAVNPMGSNPVAQVNPLQGIEKPKAALENVAPPRPTTQRPPGMLAPQGSSVQDAIRDLAKGNARAGMSVGDIGADLGSQGPGLNLPPSAGRPKSALELKSDPMGVDFRPYMLQVLAAVRRNWFAVYPEAARLGMRGQVALQFAISKQGTVAKVVYTTESGSRVLDQAAVAAISASNPLPPLPAEFKGDRIILQMTFMYNMAK